jgi:hypothetical protein
MKNMYHKYSNNMQYEEQLSIEVITVGAVTVGVSNLMTRIFPRVNPSLRLFLTGAVIHLGFEYMGWNEWYLKNGASYIKYRTKNPEEKSCPMIRKSECLFTEWQDTEYSCLEHT